MMESKEISVETELEEANIYRQMAANRNISGLNHGHTSGFSDGSNPVPERLYEAVRNGIKYVAFTDHGDATGISGQVPEDRPGYYGEENFRDPALLKSSLEDFLRDMSDEYLHEMNSFDIYPAVGMELDYDHGDRDGVRQYLYNQLVDGPLDIVLISAHHDSQGRNLGYENDFGAGTDVDEVLDEYFTQILPGAAELADEFEGVKILAHWDRPEGNTVLADEITPEMYSDAYENIKNKDVLLEYNAKTNLRNLLSQGHRTLGSRVLMEKADRFSAGTDTHRVGMSNKVDYVPDETEERLQELEIIEEMTGKVVSPLKQLDIDPKRIAIERPLRNQGISRNQKFVDNSPALN